ncbi:hypothetical protein HY969_03530 [Candidatus Kaiserbacteria bacterium]|nr:hypothetical protein [Candidatus Kaiserbacteria bacterium]
MSEDFSFKKLPKLVSADPSQSSVVPQSGMEQGASRLIKDEADHTFHEIENHSAGQMLCVRLLKGVINVSDVVRTRVRRFGVFYGDTFASYGMPIEKIAKETSSDERRADEEILRIIFKDPDKGAKYGPENNNIKIDSSGKAAYFDFEFFAAFFMYPRIRNREDRFVKRLLELGFDNGLRELDRKPSVIYVELSRLSRQALDILIDKLRRLKKAYEDDNGQFVRDVIISLPVPLREAIYFPEDLLQKSDVELANEFLALLTHRVDEMLDIAITVRNERNLTK